MQANADAKLEALGKALYGAVDALSIIAAAVNDHADKFKMHHEGISHRVRESKRLEAELQRLSGAEAKHESDIAVQEGRDSALRHGVKNLVEGLNKRELERKRVINTMMRKSSRPC